MPDYFLPSYQLSCSEMLQSLVVSEYALRHLEEARKAPHRKWGHRIIAIIQLCPVLGLIASLIEALVAWIFKKSEAKLLWRGCQRGYDGCVPYERIKEVFDKIYGRREAGVSFNRDKIQEYCEAGVCSAMSLEFVRSYLDYRRDHSPEQAVQKIKSKLTYNCQAYKVRQAAFDTIEVQKGIPGVDYSKNKVQSLANFHDLRVVHASREFHYSDCTNEDIANLPLGVYFLRMLKPLDNEKLEKHGHSMVYVKEKEAGYFYDPNWGAMRIKDPYQALRQALVDNWECFEVTKSRFYGMLPIA